MLEDVMMVYNEKNNSQLEYCTIWECRLRRLFKEELYDDALTSAKNLIKFCEKQGYLLKKVEYELFIAKIHNKSDAAHEALFQTLKIIEKAEEWQMSILILEAKILLSEIHLEMSSYYEALTLLNEIEAGILGKCNPEIKANFYIIRAKTVLYLSSEIKRNEPGAVAMKKSAIVDLEICITYCDKISLYQQMREALFLKSIICHSLAELYKRRNKGEQYKEYSKQKESLAREFNNIDQHIEKTINSVTLN